eukprot:CAMPEP_0176189982 /NCGR_PEP_ID=MMETSP0121_2-20121125/3706_1 /TAXON_ID=160619 /ORGANISM="Kryptoperidinium foliaceum, Strain CCMP 1326" /LENGTH=49 /DNA_ID= /DNA_START= /DNA_END= /DNA_ORIENTATION=
MCVISAARWHPVFDQREALANQGTALLLQGHLSVHPSSEQFAVTHRGSR